MTKRITAAHPRQLDQVVGVNLPQWAVDFVVIDLERDYQAGLYLTLKLAKNHGNAIVRQMYDVAVRFFREVDRLMTLGDAVSLRRARAMLDFPEVQEIRLGYAGLGSYGSGLGNTTLSDHVYQSLLAQPQLRQALTVEPDALCLIPSVAMDRASDVVATIAKKQIIEFTKYQAQYWGFDPRCLKSRTIAHCWDPQAGNFSPVTDTVPVDDLDRVFLLVPKEICRSGPPMNPGQYFKSLDPSGWANGDDFGSSTAKEQMLADAAANPGRLSKFVEDRMKEPDRFKPRREFRA